VAGVPLVILPRQEVVAGPHRVKSCLLRGDAELNCTSLPISQRGRGTSGWPGGLGIALPIVAALTANNGLCDSAESRVEAGSAGAARLFYKLEHLGRDRGVFQALG
jgi:hypothetical protein